MLPAVQQKLSDVFIYLEIRQRLVLCCFTFLAIINAYTMRLCLDFSLNRIVLECNDGESSKVPQVLNPKSLPNWRLELAMRLNQTESHLRRRMKAGRERSDQNQMKGTQKRQKESRETVQDRPPVQRGSRERISCSELWSRQIQSLVVMAFYAGYVLTHVPGGRLSERYGGKWVLGVAILTSAVLTLLTPAAVRQGGPYVLVGVRLLVGLCEGPCFPAVCALLAQWVPEQERGMLASCVLSGGEIGIIMVQLVSGLVMAEQDWPVAFYLVGGGAVAWFLGFTLVCYSTPDHCPFIQSEERDYIRSNTSIALLITSSREVRERPEEEREEATTDGEEGRVAPTSSAPWKSMLTNTPLWALVSASMQQEFQQKLPQDLQIVLAEMHSRASSAWEELPATIAVIGPHIGNWVASLTTGRLSDLLISEQILTRTQTRRLMSWLMIFCASMYMLQIQANGARIWSVLAMGAYYASIKLLPLDMSPNYAGTLMGISGGLGALPALVMPYLEQMEKDYSLVSSVRAALWIIGAGYISGDVQSFNQPEPQPQ
ncbi:putative inorganic phosphate cotransporter [Drosophila ficusphila]|uniref:putative inorganic phosphate cotransporter n=1 Tax=Drosophila ficusphila TaxID=30025 RepID=UPI0007E8A325|nr:putative inorganic phosphate cotransporter [Drosophila ficusphila]